MTPYDILAAIAISALLPLLGAETARCLMMLQQNSYRTSRYTRWLKTSADTTTFPRLFALAILMFGLSTFTHPATAALLTSILAICQAIRLFKVKYKKPLVWTSRALRIYTTAWALIIATAAISTVLAPSLYTAALALLACYAASHIIILIANSILAPIQYIINKRYINDARRRLEAMPGLTVIGITGSYGKTSTKHFLHHILSTHFDTLMTPGSFNTTLGVVRTIRQQLKPYNEIFIVEMGAKKPGDIHQICQLVKPQIGILTAVGPQHLETFKTLERVRNTKFELINALPHSGLAVLNNDFTPIATQNTDNVHTIRYTTDPNDPNATYTATDIRYTPTGTIFTIYGPDDLNLQLQTQLLGKHNVSNILAATIVALHLKIPAHKIAAAVRTIPPVEHRLTLRKTPSGINILDDAFNSNPVGSHNALEVLASLNSGKRIIITPGMIELGSEQYSQNHTLGKNIAQNADIAIIVGTYNRQAILDGLADLNFPHENIHTVDSFAQAQQTIGQIARPGDTILYENDLPDTFK